MLLIATAVGYPFESIYAKQNGLVKKGKNYYYYKDGQIINNSWQTLKTKDGQFRFYFGENGIAYHAKHMYKNAYNVKLYRIGKKQYGFDNKSHLANPGIYVSSTYQFLVIGNNGLYNAQETRKLRNLMKTYSETGEIGTGIYDRVISILGEPISVNRSMSCNPWNDTDLFTDVNMIYEYYEVQLVQNDRTGEYVLDNYFPINK